jgi:hypothetical protein
MQVADSKYPELEVESSEKLSPTVQALINAYESHIETLKKRIEELESKPNPYKLYPPPPGNIIPVKQKTQIRTTSQMIAALEARTRLKNVEVKEEDVK